MAFAANVDRALLLRRRALKKAEGRRRLALLCLAVIVVLAPAGYWLLANSSAFAVSGVSVSGGGALLSAEVRQAAVGAVGGRSLLQVDAGSIERAVERLPYVRSATVDRAFPHTLSIRITTYRPVAAVRSGKSAYLVSSDGRVLDTDVPAKSRLPVIRVAHGLVLTPGAHVPAGGIVAALDVLGAVPHAFIHRVGHIHKLMTERRRHRRGDRPRTAGPARLERAARSQAAGRGSRPAIDADGDPVGARLRRRLGSRAAGAGIQTLNFNLRVMVDASHAPLDREGRGRYSRTARFPLTGPRMPEFGVAQELRYPTLK